MNNWRLWVSPPNPCTERDMLDEKEIFTETLEDIAKKLWVEVEDLIAIMGLRVREEGQCIVWTGNTDGRGYGSIKRRKGDQCNRIGVHRLAYAMHVAPIQSNLSIMHLCDNKLCVNPHHLVMGTQKANMYDLRRKGGAHHGVKHSRSKLTEQQVIEIRKLAGHGYLHKDLAEQFGVSRSTISKVVTRSGYGRVA